VIYITEIHEIDLTNMTLYASHNLNCVLNIMIYISYTYDFTNDISHVD